MLPIRPRLPMLLLLLLAGASTAVLAGPPQQDRERQAPPERAERAQVERPPVRMASPPPRQERMERQERQFERARPRERAQEALSDSIRRIERNTRGQVLSAERVPYDGRSVNRIKVVDDRGRVRVYMDDPQQPAPAQPPTRGDDD